MTRFYDGKKFLVIDMCDARGIEFEEDFFGVEALRFDEKHNAYMVEDVHYLADYAEDYKNGVGDFDGYPNNDIDITLYIY